MTYDLDSSLAAATWQDAEGCCKIAEDLDRYRKAIETSRPTTIVECGTSTGASALWFARTAGCPVVSIDVSGDRISDETRREAARLDVRFLLGDSTNPAVAAFVMDCCCHRTLVSLDSDHSAAVVAAELDLYSPLVNVGGYCVVEDTIVRHMVGQPYIGSPADAVDAFLGCHDNWVVDTDLDGMFDIGLYPGGWLRRTR